MEGNGHVGRGIKFPLSMRGKVGKGDVHAADNFIRVCVRRRNRKIEK